MVPFTSMDSHTRSNRIGKSVVNIKYVSIEIYLNENVIGYSSITALNFVKRIMQFYYSLCKCKSFKRLCGFAIPLAVSKYLAIMCLVFGFVWNENFVSFLWLYKGFISYMKALDVKWTVNLTLHPFIYFQLLMRQIF